MNTRVQILFSCLLSVLLVLYLKVELLDHTVILYLMFLGTILLFSWGFILKWSWWDVLEMASNHDSCYLTGELANAHRPKLAQCLLSYPQQAEDGFHIFKYQKENHVMIREHFVRFRFYCTSPKFHWNTAPPIVFLLCMTVSPSKGRGSDGHRDHMGGGAEALYSWALRKQVCQPLVWQVRVVRSYTSMFTTADHCAYGMRAFPRVFVGTSRCPPHALLNSFLSLFHMEASCARCRSPQRYRV